jgi:hypothetical protein
LHNVFEMFGSLSNGKTKENTAALIEIPNKPRLSIDASARASSVIVLSPNFLDSGMFIYHSAPRAFEQMRDGHFTLTLDTVFA